MVEDIVDSGLTLKYLLKNLAARKPATLEVAALLRKSGIQQVELDLRYVGFDIPNEFVVGYGLDYAEKFRNLPYIGTLNPGSRPTEARGPASGPGATIAHHGPQASDRPGSSHLPREVRTDHQAADPTVFPVALHLDPGRCAPAAPRVLGLHLGGHIRGRTLRQRVPGSAHRRSDPERGDRHRHLHDQASDPTDSDETFVTTFAPEREPDVEDDLQAAGIPYEVVPERSTGILGNLIWTLLPTLLIIGALFWLLNRSQGAGGRVMQFGRSKHKQVTKDTPKTTFNDVAGLDDAIEELQEVKEYLQNPAKFQAMGAKIPRGVLLFGPPGTGKTLLARAVAGEAGVPFFSIERLRLRGDVRGRRRRACPRPLRAGQGDRTGHRVHR